MTDQQPISSLAAGRNGGTQAPVCCDGKLSADDPTVAVTVEVEGVPRSIDRCIAPLVEALNAAGMPTMASCCGHGRMPSRIALRDGRELVIS